MMMMTMMNVEGLLQKEWQAENELISAHFKNLNELGLIFYGDHERSVPFFCSKKYVLDVLLLTDIIHALHFLNNFHCACIEHVLD